MSLEAIILSPEYRDYVWGGQRLRPGQGITAEAWVVYEGARVAEGAFKGLTLGELARQQGEALLGRQALRRTGLRFPLLIKLLDCAAWLSLQVHPNDEQARRLEGPGQNGKTEAWHFIEAEPGAQILCGLKPGTSSEIMAQAVRGGSLLEWMRRHDIHAGDSILIPAGTVHALGPGLMVYEVQQTSDITYRVFDWNRPASDGRPLHIEKSIEVIRPDLDSRLIPPPVLENGRPRELVSSAYFRLEMLAARQNAVEADTRGESFHAITLLNGWALVTGDGWSQELGKWQSLVVPAESGAYRITAQGEFRALRASVEVEN